MAGRSCAVTVSLLLVFSLALGAAHAFQTEDDVNSRVMWASQQGVMRRTLLATNDSTYEQQLIDAANAHALAALALTPRPDPTNGMKKYEGGYDVTNMHYWAVSGGLLLKSGLLGPERKGKSGCQEEGMSGS